MNVGELIEYLEGQPPELPVYLFKDSDLEELTYGHLDPTLTDRLDINTDIESSRQKLLELDYLKLIQLERALSLVVYVSDETGVMGRKLKEVREVLAEKEKI